MALLDDGRILTVGDFTSCNEEKADYIAMLDSNGVFDDTFSEVNKPDQPVTCLAVLSNQKAVLGGCFSSYNEAIHNRTVRIKTEDQ